VAALNKLVADNVYTCNSAGTVDDNGKCTCTAGYTGTTCQDIDECAGQSCSNHGSCKDGINQFTCECTAGYTGTTCQDIDECAGQLCSNHGSCTDGINKFTCECTAGYTGTTCQFSNANTCNSAGTVDATGTCTCDGPETGLGATCSELSNAKDCAGADASLRLGTVTPTGTCTDCPALSPNVATAVRKADCSCPTGYINPMCDECAPNTHERFDLTGGKFECQLSGNTEPCILGQYFDISATPPECTACKQGKYADGFLPGSTTESDNQLRLDCTPCPTATAAGGAPMEQTSPAGSDSPLDCFPKYQAGKPEQEFCYGKATADAANGKPIEAALLQIDDDAPGTPIGTACETAAKGLGFNYSGVKYPPQGCFLDNAAKTVTYYVRNKDHGSLDLKDAEPDPNQSPICQRHTCDVATDARTFLTKDDNPDKVTYCKTSIVAANEASADEAETNLQVFLPVVGAITTTVVITGYWFVMKRHFLVSFFKLPSEAHEWVWAGIVPRLFDVQTDWAFFGISLQSLTFNAACEDHGSFDSSTIRTVCLAFCIIGTFVAPLDVWGSFQRMILDKPEVASWIILASSITEDVPQLSLNALYISIMYKYSQRPENSESDVNAFDPISMISLFASVANICYNIWLMLSTLAVRQYKKKLAAKETADHVVINDIFNGDNVLQQENDELKKENKRMAKQLKKQAHSEE
jgi:hypothetical protein